MTLQPVKKVAMNTHRLKTVRTSSQISEVIAPGRETFAMIEKSALFDLDNLMKTDVNAARLIVALVRHLENGSDGVVIVSNKGLQEILEVSESTVARALRVLIKGNWIQRMRVGGAHAIAVNKSVAWVGARGKMDRAVFSATVIAVRSEQDEHALSAPVLKQVPMTQEGEHVLPVGSDPEPPAQGMLEGVVPVTVQSAKKPPAKHWRKPSLQKNKGA